MPKKMKAALTRRANKKGLTGPAKAAFIYGTLQRKTSWKPARKTRKRK